MKMCLKTPQLRAGLLLIMLMGGASRSAFAIDGVAPDREIQHLIDTYSHATRWTPEFYQQLIALRTIAIGNGPTPQKRGPLVFEGEKLLIPQAAFYSAQGTRREDVQDPPLNAGLQRAVFKRLMRDLEIPDYRVMATLLPYVDTADENLRTFIRENVLDGDGQDDPVERDCKDPIVGAILEYLMNDVERKMDMPWSIVQILYWKAPSAAVHYFYRGPRERHMQVYWGEHVVQDTLWKKAYGFSKSGDTNAAIAELDKLSQFDDWAVKLYVAEMLRRHEEFRNSKIIERLRSDKHPLVSKAVDVPYRAEEKKERSLFWP